MKPSRWWKISVRNNTLPRLFTYKHLLALVFLTGFTEFSAAQVSYKQLSGLLKTPVNSSKVVEVMNLLSDYTDFSFGEKSFIRSYSKQGIELSVLDDTLESFTLTPNFTGYLPLNLNWTDNSSQIENKIERVCVYKCDIINEGKNIQIRMNDDYNSPAEHHLISIDISKENKISYPAKAFNDQPSIPYLDNRIGTCISGNCANGVGTIQAGSLNIVAQFEDGLANGKAVLKDSNGLTFKGVYRNGYPNGYGIAEIPNRYKYSGDVYYGFLSGDARVEIPGVGIAEGTASQFPKKLTGKVFLKNGQIYSGSIAMLQFEGKGILTTKEFTMNATFSKGKVVGNATVKYKNGLRYEGLIKDGKQHGLGRLYYPDGKYLEGNFFEGKPDGTMDVYNNAFRLLGKSVYEKGKYISGIKLM